MNPTSMTETPSSLPQLSEFIILRKQQKNILQNKNSLSNFNLKNQKNTKGKNENPKHNQALFNLINRLDEQLKEGHTTLTFNELNQAQFDLLKKWETQDWLTWLPPKNIASDTVSTSIDSQTVNTPLILQQVIENDTVSKTVIWLHRQWYAEHRLASQLYQIANRLVADEFDFDNTNLSKKRKGRAEQADKQPNAQQQLAIDNANRFALSIITGGPGTGKTFTVAKLVTNLQQQHHAKKQHNPFLPPLSIALTAPTGKAAQRMEESLTKSLDGKKHGIDDAKTLHRLLGINQNGLPRYHADNSLPYDLVIVDEASMLGLELASMLVDAIKPTARLILLGDANQLAAVDAGSVLADICQVPQLQAYRTELTESKRFDDTSFIGQFARAINLTPADVDPNNDKTYFNRHKLQKVYQLLQPMNWDKTTAETEVDNGKIAFYPIRPDTNFWQIYAILAKGYENFFELMQIWHTNPPNLQDEAVRKQLFSTFDSYRILTAGHQGQLGSEMLNKRMGEQFVKYTHLPRTSQAFYHGLPIMVTRNDYQLGLFNGDIGICIAIGKVMWVCFADKVIASSRLSLESCESAFAMTIHKSQGSEFDKVAVCLDRVHGRLLSQELVYTAVTRSKGELMLISQSNILNLAVLQKGNRQTGLALQF